MDTIGQRIKKARERLKLTQTQVADRLDISSQLYYKYERDIITNIPSDKIEAMAKMFHVSPAYLMGWETDPKEPQEVYLKVTIDTNGKANTSILNFEKDELNLIDAYRHADKDSKIIVERVLYPFLKRMRDQNWYEVEEIDKLAELFDQIVIDSDEPKEKTKKKPKEKPKLNQMDVFDFLEAQKKKNDDASQDDQRRED